MDWFIAKLWLRCTANAELLSAKLCKNLASNSKRQDSPTSIGLIVYSLQMKVRKLSMEAMLYFSTSNSFYFLQFSKRSGLIISNSAIIMEYLSAWYNFGLTEFKFEQA